MGKKKKNEDEETYVLAPKGCLFVAMSALDLVDMESLLKNKDIKFDSMFDVLEERFKRNGFIVDEGEEPKEQKGTPRDIFIKTVRSYYTNLDDDLLDTLYDSFCINMSKAGHLKEK